MPEVTGTQIAVVFFAAVLTNNIVLSNFLGLCSYFSLSGSIRTAYLMGLSVLAVTVLSSLVNYVVYHHLLLPGGWLGEADLSFLTFLVFIAVIAGLVQVLEGMLKRWLPEVAGRFGPFLALITVNCAIMGVNLFMIEPVLDYGFLRSMAFSAGSGAGWLLVICMMAAIRIRLQRSDVPASLQGMGIHLLVTGIMAMVFMGFIGMIDL